MNESNEVFPKLNVEKKYNKLNVKNKNKHSCKPYDRGVLILPEKPSLNE